jgi:hypothetical protein
MISPQILATDGSPESSIRLRWPLWIGLAAVVLPLAAAVGGDPLDENSGNAALPDQPLKLANPAVYVWIFGADANAARQHLDTLLQQKVSIVDRVCRLTDAQKRKVELAGRGDIKRLIDRVEEFGIHSQLAKNNGESVNALVRKAEELKRDLISALSNDDSLFAKSLKATLTSDQFDEYEPLRSVIRIGGMVHTRQRGSDEMLEINLRGTELGGGGLALVRELPNVRILRLDGTRDTDAGLAQLKGITKVNYISLSNSDVTDAGLEHLQGMTELEWLALDVTQVTDAGLAHLNGLTKLKQLSLSKSQVSDAGLAHLKGMTSLHQISLNDTHISDAGLAQLKGMTGLRALWLGNTKVTDRGVADMRSALPKLMITNK